MRQITITIDGPAGSGKGTTARGLAERMGYQYLDTGAMYRAVALVLSEHGIRPTNIAGISTYLEHLDLDFNQHNHISINGVDREEDIRTKTISSLSSTYSPIPVVREWLVSKQQEIIGQGGYVLDGRDAGSVIAPEAELKIYLDCDVAIRAQRRALEYGISDPDGITAISKDLEERDQRDRTREHSPLVILPDSVVVDTSNVTIEEQIEAVFTLAQETIHQ